jgi:hypothetical protein
MRAVPLDATHQPLPAGALFARDEDEFLAALRARVTELDISQATLDAIAGLPVGFSGKLLCNPPMRHLSSLTLWLVLGAVGFKLALISDAEGLAKVQNRLVKCKVPNRRTTMITIARRRMSPWLFDGDRARKIGHLGGLARAKKLHANAALSEVRRQAAFKRWRHRPVKTS